MSSRFHESISDHVERMSADELALLHGQIRPEHTLWPLVQKLLKGTKVKSLATPSELKQMRAVAARNREAYERKRMESAS